MITILDHVRIPLKRGLLKWNWNVCEKHVLVSGESVVIESSVQGLRFFDFQRKLNVFKFQFVQQLHSINISHSNKLLHMIISVSLSVKMRKKVWISTQKCHDFVTSSEKRKSFNFLFSSFFSKSTYIRNRNRHHHEHSKRTQESKIKTKAKREGNSEKLKLKQKALKILTFRKLNAEKRNSRKHF